MKLWNRNFGSISEGPEVANLSLLVKNKFTDPK